MDEKYPDIEICSEANSSEGNLYFGPYTSKNTVEKGICAIKDHSKILCNNSSRKALGCLKYSMNMCIGMCTTNPSKEAYFALIEKVIKLLRGIDFSILQEMEQEMNNASLNLNFECAAKYRDYIKAVNYLISTAKILDFTEANKNIAVVEYLNNEEIKFFLIRYNTILFSECYKLSNVSIDEVKDTFKRNIIVHFSEVLKSSVNVNKDEIDEAHIIYNYLNSKESGCKYIAILGQWIKDKDRGQLDRAVDELL